MSVQVAVTSLYAAILIWLSAYGLLGLLTLFFYWRHRRHLPAAPDSASNFPRVTVQLPLYNERYVVRRLIAAAAALDYPRDRLQIQVLDDSTDETAAIAAQCVDHYNRKGVHICLQRRRGRSGYKAGALAEGMTQSDGEYVAIFDADFLPPADFLRRTIPYFLADRHLGMIQARWGHLNEGQSALTAVQAMALDKHFALEMLARDRADLFPKFNGTAGIWRRACIEDAGGWQSDTLCEDLCLSTRAVLRGWQFLFLNDLVVPAELPASIAALKNQQGRWATGSIQCLLKFGRQILASRAQSPLARLYALLSMSAYLANPLFLVLLLLQAPLLLLDLHPPSWLALVGLAGLSQPLLFIAGQGALHRDWWRRLRHLPTLFLVAIGIAPSISWTLLAAFFGNRPFRRTPKLGSQPAAQGASRMRAQQRGASEDAHSAERVTDETLTAAEFASSDASGYRLPLHGWLVLESILFLYSLFWSGFALVEHNLGASFLFLTANLGFGYVMLLGSQEAVAGSQD